VWVDAAETERPWWRIPPREQVEARVRWIALVTVLATVASCAPPLIRNSPLPALMVGLLLILTGGLLFGHRHGRVPVAVDVLVAGCFTVVLMISSVPLVGFGIGFQTIWYHGLFSDTRRTVARAGLFLVAYAGGSVLWWSSQWRPNPDVYSTALAAGVFTTITLSIFCSMLAQSIRARAASSRRERLIARTGTQLLGATDTAQIRETAWQAMQALVADSPGLRVARLVRTAEGIVPDRTEGFVAAPAAVVPVPTSADLASAQVRQAVTAGLDEGCGWDVLTYAEFPDTAVALGHPGKVPPDLRSTADSILNQVVLAFRNSRTHAELVTQALTDPLTGLANRQGFTEATARLLNGASNLTVMFIDLDDFKDVNDNLGHAAGDDLLTRVAAMLRSLVRDDDVVARLGGDEFAILLRGIDEATAHGIAGRIVLGLSTLASGPRGEYTIGASIGLVNSEGGLALAELLVRADVAMYQAKAQGKGRVQEWHPALMSHTEQLA